MTQAIANFTMPLVGASIAALGYSRARLLCLEPFLRHCF
jgi:hypothetical protein